MPVISKVGARSWRVRAVYAGLFAVLLVGAVTMVYPFLLMLSGSVRSEADAVDITPFPRFWTDDMVLFQKYVESKYNVRLAGVEASWWERCDNWRTIRPPSAAQSKYLDDYLRWRDACDTWTLGQTSGARLLPINARLFRQSMYDEFRGDIDAFCRRMGVPVRSWNAVIPPPPQPGRFPALNDGLSGAFIEFARTRPVSDRIIENLDGSYWRNFLTPRYTTEIANYNLAHDTHYASYEEILLTQRVPAGGLERKDWEEYVRTELKLEFIRLDPSLAGPFRQFLVHNIYQSIEEFNQRYAMGYRTFDEVPFSRILPSGRIAQVDWEKFVRDRRSCPIEAIEVYGPRQAFEEFVAHQRGVDLRQIAPVRLPMAAADYHDCMIQKSALRWEFTTRNYKQVLQYVVLHGRGIFNTVIYCLLAVGAAVVVNPLAAYALSRYRLPTTYKILLFCMATMAFPAEVTMIPAFLLMKRFPLWPLAGGLAAFFVALWGLNHWLRKLAETLRLTLALGVAVLVGAWLIPALIYKPTISLLNTFAALVLPYMANGFFIFLLKGFFDSLPQELYESAEIDGANEWTKFWHITMSLSKPILAVIALSAFTQAYSAFMMALIIIPDQKMWTLMVWIYELQSQSHQAVVYASLVIAAIPTFIVFALCQNLIIRGIVVPVEK